MYQIAKGRKYNYAVQWKIQIVHSRWVEDCASKQGIHSFNPHKWFLWFKWLSQLSLLLFSALGRLDELLYPVNVFEETSNIKSGLQPLLDSEDFSRITGSSDDFVHPNLNNIKPPPTSDTNPNPATNTINPNPNTNTNTNIHNTATTDLSTSEISDYPIEYNNINQSRKKYKVSHIHTNDENSNTDNTEHTEALPPQDDNNNNINMPTNAQYYQSNDADNGFQNQLLGDNNNNYSEQQNSVGNMFLDGCKIFICPMFPPSYEQQLVQLINAGGATRFVSVSESSFHLPLFQICINISSSSSSSSSTAFSLC